MTPTPIKGLIAGSLLNVPTEELLAATGATIEEAVFFMREYGDLRRIQPTRTPKETIEYLADYHGKPSTIGDPHEPAHEQDLSM